VKDKLEKATADKTLLRKKIYPRLVASLDGLTVLAQPSSFLLSFSLMMGNWLCGVIEIHVLLNSVGIQSPYWWAGFVLGVVSLGIASLRPSQIGVYGYMVGALSLQGVPTAQALAVHRCSSYPKRHRSDWSICSFRMAKPGWFIPAFKYEVNAYPDFIDVLPAHYSGLTIYRAIGASAGGALIMCRLTSRFDPMPRSRMA
jgi:hypothetical protein